jgi:hypothetical protein
VRQERGEYTTNPELNHDLLVAYAEVFLPRYDRYPLQSRNGSYFAVEEAVTSNLLKQHLYGEVTLGAYALNQQSQANWTCFDADDETEWQGLLSLTHELSEAQVPSYLEPSRRGGHLWLFFPEPLTGQDTRRFAKQLLSEKHLTSVEVYPKQDALKTGPGSLVRLPLGIHRKVNHRYHFVTLSGQPIAPSIRGQVQMLAYPKRIPSTFVERVLSLAPEPRPLPSPPSFEGKTIRIVGDEVSDRIKNRITVYDFVGQFVQLDRGGRGLCPFHDDHRESFSVDQGRNYWHCFAGCKGQTVIDFWMQWQNVNFKQAVKELATMLL